MIQERRLIPFYIHELDLGFNDLGGYHHQSHENSRDLVQTDNHDHHQYQQQQQQQQQVQRLKSKKNTHFLHSIQKLLQDELVTGTCPTILRLNTCG